MQLYSVSIGGVYPMQCATVTDCREKAESIAAKIIAALPHLRGVCYVEKAGSFYPSHMAACDLAIRKAMES